MHRYRSNLALLWLVWAGLLALYFAFRLVQGDTAVAVTVGWLSPHLMPTLSLVGGVTALTKAGPEADAGPELRSAYLRALIASIFYLVVVTVATAAVSLTLADAKQLLEQFAGLLGLLQGATAATLGVFFAKAPTKS